MQKILAHLLYKYRNLPPVWHLIGAGLLIFIAAAGFSIVATTTRPEMLAPAQMALAQDDKPVDNWYVCRDLGIGVVPGLPDVRQRFQLCHASGWVVNAYCLQPNLPAPEIGTVCTRINEDTYSCGVGFQEVREYRVLQTPPLATAAETITDTPIPTTPAPDTATPTEITTSSPTPTGTATATSTATSTPSPTSTATTVAPTASQTASTTPSPGPETITPGPGTASVTPVVGTATSTPGASTPTATPVTAVPTAISSAVAPGTPWPRELPGAPAMLTWRSWFNWPGATATPFQPAAPSPTNSAPDIPAVETPTAPGSPFIFYGADLNPGSGRIKIRVYPDGKTVNRGQMLKMLFNPGTTCAFGERRGCVTAFYNTAGQPIIFASIHSGIRGEGQELRQALEGTFLFQAAYSRPQVRENLQALAGAGVMITQGEWEEGGFQVVGAARIPGAAMQEYIHTPLPQVLELVIQYNPHLSGLISPEHPLLVIETCGWRLPGEAAAPGTTATSASIYLLFIQPPS